MADALYQISAPHFEAGIVVQGDCVTEAAPIVRYMIGWSRTRVRSYCTRKNWSMTMVEQVATAKEVNDG